MVCLWNETISVIWRIEFISLSFLFSFSTSFRFFSLSASTFSKKTLWLAWVVAVFVVAGRGAASLKPQAESPIGNYFCFKVADAREFNSTSTAKELGKSEPSSPVSPFLLLPRLVKQTKKGHVHVQQDEQRAQLVNVNFSHLTKWKFCRQGAAPSASTPTGRPPPGHGPLEHHFVCEFGVDVKHKETGRRFPPVSLSYFNCHSLPYLLLPLQWQLQQSTHLNI